MKIIINRLLETQALYRLQKRGNSKEGFAAEIGMDRAYFGGVERGERNMAALNLVRIAAGLRVEVGELFPSVSALRELR